MNPRLQSARKISLVVLTYYLVTSAAAALLGALQPATHIPDAIVQITQLGPTIGVLSVLLLFRKDVQPYIKVGLSIKPHVLKRLLAAVALCLAIFAVSIGWFMLYGKKQSLHLSHHSRLSVLDYNYISVYWRRFRRNRLVLVFAAIPAAKIARTY